MNTNKKDQVVIYTDKHGDIEFLADIKKDTLWTTQDQITKLFGVDQSVVSRHIANIFEDGEIDKNSNMQKMHRNCRSSSAGGLFAGYNPGCWL